MEQQVLGTVDVELRQPPCKLRADPGPGARTGVWRRFSVRRKERRGLNSHRRSTQRSHGKAGRRPSALRSSAGVVRQSAKDDGEIGLDQRSARQFAHADRGTGRIGLGEITHHHLIDDAEVRQIGDIDVDLDHVGK